jgi:hypothetical protein
MTKIFMPEEFQFTPPTKIHQPSADEIAKLERIFEQDPLWIPTKEEQELLWKNRHYCFDHPHSVTKFVSSIPWGDSSAVSEAYAMLSIWPLLSVPGLTLEVCCIFIYWFDHPK